MSFYFFFKLINLLIFLHFFGERKGRGLLNSDLSLEICAHKSIFLSRNIVTFSLSLKRIKSHNINVKKEFKFDVFEKR